MDKKTRESMLKGSKKCELCGSRRSLEVHHIIPKCAGGLDDADNLIVVCQSCHAKLTPRSILTKIGLKKVLEPTPEATRERVFTMICKEIKKYGYKLDNDDWFDILETVLFN